MTLKQRLTRQLVSWLVSQAGRPRGLAGQLNGLLFAHRPSNRRRNRWVVSLLQVRPTDRVLEVGFGPGVAIAALADRATRGRIYGIDHSAVMVRQASRRNAAAIRDGRVELIQAPVERLPDLGAALDLVLAVNTVGFWPDPVARLGELRARLRPGGRIALVVQPRMKGVTTAGAVQELRDRLERAGFTEPRQQVLDLEPPVGCVIGTNPG